MRLLNQFVIKWPPKTPSHLEGLATLPCEIYRTFFVSQWPTLHFCATLYVTVSVGIKKTYGVLFESFSLCVLLPFAHSFFSCWLPLPPELLYPRHSHLTIHCWHGQHPNLIPPELLASSWQQKRQKKDFDHRRQLQTELHLSGNVSHTLPAITHSQLANILVMASTQQRLLELQNVNCAQTVFMGPMSFLSPNNSVTARNETQSTDPNQASWDQLGPVFIQHWTPHGRGVSRFMLVLWCLTLSYLRGKQSERQTAQYWDHFDVGPVRIPDVTKVTITSTRLWQTATGFMVISYIAPGAAVCRPLACGTLSA